MSRHPDLVRVGKKIRRFRKERGYSQESFANACGLGRSYYGGVERGERNIAALNLIKVARQLGVPVGEFFEP